MPTLFNTIKTPNPLLGQRLRIFYFSKTRQFTFLIISRDTSAHLLLEMGGLTAPFLRGLGPDRTGFLERDSHLDHPRN